MSTIQFQNPKQVEPKKLITILAIFAIICAIFCSVIGCNPQKQLSKAYQKVLADSASMEKMRAVVERIWPCIPAIGKEGKTTTITTTVVDTAQVRALQHIVDSILSKQKITPYTNIDSLKQALSVEIMKGIQPKVIHDSTFRVDTVPDTRAIELMQQRLDAAKQAQNNAEGQIIAKDKEVLQLKSLAANRLYILIGIGSFIAIIFGIGIYLKFFSPAGAAGSTMQKFFNK